LLHRPDVILENTLDHLRVIRFSATPRHKPKSTLPSRDPKMRFTVPDQIGVVLAFNIEEFKSIS
jgi:hypothetical protein